MHIAPSILSVLDKDIKEIIFELESNDIKYLHLDVMDNEFVQNKTFDFTFIKEIRSYSKMIFDTHLMIINPENYIDDYIESGSDIITIHIEASNKIDEIIKKVHAFNRKVGISIKPKTKIEKLIPYLDSIDLVLVMSVEPGFGGQKFDDDSIEKIKFLKNYKTANNLHYLIEVDGGINNKTIQKVKDAGIDIAVVGTYLFNEKTIKENLKEIR